MGSFAPLPKLTHAIHLHAHTYAHENTFDYLSIHNIWKRIMPHQFQQIISVFVVPFVSPVSSPLCWYVGMFCVCVIFYEIHIIYIWFKAHYPKIYEFTICLIDAKLKLASKTFRWEMKYRCYASLMRSTLSLSRYISLSFIGCGRVFVNYLVSRLRYSQLFSR